MATITSNTAFKNAILDATPEINTMFNGGTITIRTGTAPGAGNAATGTVLATFTVGAAQWAASSSGARALTATITDSSADNTGTAGHFRLVSDTPGTYVIEGDATAIGGGGAMELITTSIIATQPVDLTQFTFTLGH
jgi:hypothetical protein